ncbi:hypothetical protein Angca_000261, partial [Angiostrongylus cantonensis]
RTIMKLDVFKDNDGIIRCKGRLGHTNMPIETRQPMLIINNTKMAEIIVHDAHLPFHCSASQTMARVRQRFWIDKLRSLTRKIIRRYVPCQRMNSLPYNYSTTEDLPARRVVRSHPFEHVGIDYFGPLSVKRDDDIRKIYGIIITCATTRLLHLELVHNMSTNALLLALRRFFARRGVPSTIT